MLTPLLSRAARRRRKGQLNVKNRAPDQVRKMQRVVWYERQIGKTLSGQWINVAFWTVWVSSITQTFTNMGLEHFLPTMFGRQFKPVSDVDGLIPITGTTSRRIIEHAMQHIETVTTVFDVVDVGGARVVQWRDNQDQALEEWGELAGKLTRVAVATVVTDELQHYVRGTEAAYHPSTRHMFVRGNTVEKIGMPYELRWRMKMAGHTISLYGDWERIRKTRDETGLTIFQMLQVQIHDELDKILKQVN